VEHVQEVVLLEQSAREMTSSLSMQILAFLVEHVQVLAQLALFQKISCILRYTAIKGFPFLGKPFCVLITLWEIKL
jgi:hypothetical protein